MNPDELIRQSFQLYNLSIDSLDKGDLVGACEKAWGVIEAMRKALLVKAGISYDSAKSISIGIPLFTRLLKKLGRKDLLEKYTYFNYKLHVMGLYEGITEGWEIEDIIREDLPLWLEEMKSLIDKLNINLSKAEEIMKEMEKLKRRLILTHAEIVSLRNQLDKTIEELVR